MLLFKQIIYNCRYRPTHCVVFIGKKLKMHFPTLHQTFTMQSTVCISLYTWERYKPKQVNQTSFTPSFKLRGHVYHLQHIIEH